VSAGFTSGPWQLAKTHTARPKWFDVIDSDGRTKPYTLVTRVRLESNARLIAAAPELLEALEALAHKCDCSTLVDGSSIETLRAHAILAKARGEQ
jgi:hypothetical protein